MTKIMKNRCVATLRKMENALKIFSDSSEKPTVFNTDISCSRWAGRTRDNPILRRMNNKGAKPLSKANAS